MKKRKQRRLGFHVHFHLVLVEHALIECLICIDISELVLWRMKEEHCIHLLCFHYLFLFLIINRLASTEESAAAQIIHPRKQVEEYLKDTLDTSRATNKAAGRSYVLTFSSIWPMVYENLQVNDAYPQIRLNQFDYLLIYKEILFQDYWRMDS